MRKKESSNYINEEFLFEVCERNSAISIISGRWKSQIVYQISKGKNRFHLLQQVLPNVSETVLARQLKELESHAILVKIKIPNTVPLGVKYVLTNKGNDLVPILDKLCQWGKVYAGGKKIFVRSEKTTIRSISPIRNAGKKQHVFDRQVGRGNADEL